MDRKALRHWLKKQVHRIKADVEEAVETLSVDSIHDLRTGTKKLLAMLRLAGEQSGEEYKLPKDFHDLYHAAGDLRNAQVALEALEHDMKGALPAFEGWLIHKIKHASHGFKKSYHPKIFEHVEDRVGEVDTDIEMPTLQHFVSQRLLLIHQYAQPDADDTALHEVRKQAKDLQYVLAVCKKIWPEAYEVFSPLESSLEQLSEKAGAYNDRRNLLAMISEFKDESSDKMDAKETSTALQAAQDWARAKATERQELLLLTTEFWHRFGTFDKNKETA